MIGIENEGLYALKAAIVFGAMMTIVVLGIRARHPFRRFGPANVVTTVRALLVALVAALIGEAAGPETAWSALGASAVIAALDGVDGWLARRTGTATAFGARFDMETDAFFILVLSALVWQHGKSGPWVLLCGLMRYGFVAAGWLIPWMAGPLRSTVRGKAVAIAQIAGLSAALAPPVRPPISIAVAAITLGALAWSFAVDIRWLSRRYRA